MSCRYSEYMMKADDRLNRVAWETVNGFAYFMFAKIVNMFFSTHMFINFVKNTP